MPWLVNGGDVDASAARAAHYAATRGAHGITLPGDFKVTATPTPSQGVRIATGSCTIRNAQAAGESYQGLARSSTDVGIDVTGATRYDLVIGQIIDPDFAPWTAADVPDAVNGPYFLPKVIKGVSASTTKASDVVSYSAEAFARIAVPASGNVTNAMVTDLRRLAQPRTDRQIFMSNPTAEVPMQNTAGAVWPDFRPQVVVPDWATAAYMVVTLSSIGQRGGAAQGVLTSVMNGSLAGASGFRANDIGFDLDAPVAGGSRHTLVVGGGFPDVRSIAGRVVPLQTEARQDLPDSNPGYLVTVAGTQVIFDIQFYETAV